MGLSDEGKQKKINFKRIVIDGDINNPRSFHKVAEENAEIEIKLPQGLRYNTNVVLEYQGMKHTKEDIYGDLLLNIIKSKTIPEEEKNYSIVDGKLHYRLQLSLKESLLGFNHTFTSPTNEKINIYNDSITGNISKIIKNIIVDISVDLPTYLSDDMKEGLSKVFNYNCCKSDDNAIKVSNMKTYIEEQNHDNSQFMGFNMGNPSQTQCVNQ